MGRKRTLRCETASQATQNKQADHLFCFFKRTALLLWWLPEALPLFLVPLLLRGHIQRELLSTLHFMTACVTQGLLDGIISAELPFVVHIQLRANGGVIGTCANIVLFCDAFSGNDARTIPA